MGLELGGRGHQAAAVYNPPELFPMSKPNDLSRSLLAFDQSRTLVAVIEMSQSSWLVSGIVPGIERQPLKKLATDENALLRLLHRWRGEAEERGEKVERIVVAFEAGRDGFWLARWLRSRGIEAYVMHASSVAVSREHRRAKTDRLDTELLKRAFLGWLRGEREHCKPECSATGQQHLGRTRMHTERLRELRNVVPAPPARRLNRSNSCAAARVLKAQKPVESAISGTTEGSSGVAAIGWTFACLAGGAVRES
jgi:hypothetical protein